jgi:predicted ribosomally synthesized peptide with SipW-like signal peptide
VSSPSLRRDRRQSRVPRGRRPAWLRVRAILAGGLVFGIGAAVTVAAWTDDEYSSATITSGRFGIVGSVNGAAFTDHASSPGPSLTFTPTLGAVYPGSPAGFTTVQVRTASVATGGFDSVPGVVRMSASTLPSDALAAALVYAVRLVPSGSSCNEALFSNGAATVIVPNATTLSTQVPANVQSVSAAGALTLSYCIRIALPDTAGTGSQSLTTSVTWQFAGATS